MRRLVLVLLALSAVAASSASGFVPPRWRSGAACAGSSLRLTPATTALSEKTGQHTSAFALRNTGPPCTLEGYPTVVLTDAAGRTLAFRYHRGGDQMITTKRPGFVTVPSQGTAYFAINKYRCDIRASAVARVVHVTLPGSSGYLSLRLRHYPIIDFCSEAPSRIVSVSPIVAKLPSAFLGR